MIVAIIVFVVIVLLVALAERSLRRQRGGGLQRTAEQDRALGRATVMQGRWPGSGG